MSETRGSASDEPDWDSVDCALYFDGETLELARRVELVQLKYSSDPDRAWTVARLTDGSGAKRKKSVPHKLAEDFTAARARIRPGAELNVRFVNNQRVADSEQCLSVLGRTLDTRYEAVARFDKGMRDAEQGAGIRRGTSGKDRSSLRPEHGGEGGGDVATRPDRPRFPRQSGGSRRCEAPCA